MTTKVSRESFSVRLLIADTLYYNQNKIKTPFTCFTRVANVAASVKWRHVLSLGKKTLWGDFHPGPKTIAEGIKCIYDYVNWLNSGGIWNSAKRFLRLARIYFLVTSVVGIRDCLLYAFSFTMLSHWLRKWKWGIGCQILSFVTDVRERNCSILFKARNERLTVNPLCVRLWVQYRT